MFNNLFSKREKTTSGWFGNYPSWAAVSAVAGGYDSDIILRITKDSILKVKNGDGVYERDSVIFDEKQCPYALLAYLQLSAALKKTALHVLDFGGSLGSTYFQIKEYLTKEVCASWNVVEQAHYVSCGKEFFEDDVLKFYPSIEACKAVKQISLVILSGVVQYLEKPHEFLRQLVNHSFEFLLFDRTAFNNKASDRLTLQVVPDEIYPASYPSWFFDQDFFLSHFSEKYKKVAEFPSYVEGEEIMKIDNKPSGSDKGFYFINKSFHA
jgi:putative methyltransferase (TIGR04325 family)